MVKYAPVILLIVALLIAATGVATIYSSTVLKEGRLWQDIYKRQLLWVVLGTALYVFAARMDYRRLWDWSPVLYALAVFFLLLVCILGITKLGAQRWLKIAWFNFQPSEFAKIVVIIFLARYFSRRSLEDVYVLAARYGPLHGIVYPFLAVCVPMGLIIEQPDLGSGLLVLFIFIVMVFLAHIRMKHIWVMLGILIAPSPLFWNLLHEYQRKRLMVFLNPNADPLGAGYTIIQSKIAIGSGGLFGKGWMGGTQSQLHFLPESHTDFIFATFSEQWGFTGCLLLFALYFLLIWMGIAVGRRTSDPFGRMLALGMSAMLGIQMVINVAMNMGLAPVVGVPLPLMSYGGTSILITFFSLGTLASISRRRTLF